MMRINELIQVGTESREVVVPATFDEDGVEQLAPERVETMYVPVMRAVTRDATPEEEARAAADAAAAEEWERTRPRTAEERLTVLEEDMDGVTDAETGELAEIRAALVELAGIVMGG